MLNHIKIYCKNPTNRHRFVFDLLFKKLLGVTYVFHNEADSAHLNYSDTSNDFGIQCIPHGLLQESDIRNSLIKEIEVQTWKESSCFFKTSLDKAYLPFDLFSASFFLVSRYEEYIDFTADHHSRFPATESIMYKNGLLEEPLVNQWALLLRDALKSKFANLQFNERKYEYRSTIDIDQAWKFRNKGLLRNLAGSVQDLFQGKWENLLNRWPVLWGVKNDPFYNFDWQYKVHRQYSTQVDYFVLLGNRSKFDKNIDVENTHFQALIKELYSYENCSVGIHPSYDSNNNHELVKLEIKRLETIIDSKVVRSRQHFLMHKMPETYEVLISNGITEEHTMGYSTHLGFRAGIASPFNFFNLRTNTETDLRLIPFCAMDITPLHYLEKTPEQAIEILSQLMLKVKEVDGLFVSLWHNESFSESERWNGWRKVYLSLLKNSK